MTNAKMVSFTLCGTFATVGTALAQIFGGWDAPLQALLLLMAVDYITGILCALVWHKSPKTQDGAFESNASIKGLFRKMGILACVLVAYQLDHLAGTNVVRTGTILFFVANDGLSIVENLGIMGLPMPSVMTNAFEALRAPEELL